MISKMFHLQSDNNINPTSLKQFVVTSKVSGNKKDELADFLASDNIDIIIGSETHLSYNISNAEILPPEYTAARKDRDDGYGGVIIIYKRSLIVEEIHHHKSTEIVSIKLKNNPTIISSCYRPPNCSLQTNESLTKEINALCKNSKTIASGSVVILIYQTLIG